MASTDVLRGKRIRLTAFTKEDMGTVRQWYEDAEYLRLFDASPAYPQSVEQLEAQLSEAQKNKDSYSFAARPLDSESLIGLVELEVLWAHQNAWLSIGIGDPANRGKGYGSEMLQLVLRFGFHELNLHRIQLTVFGYNTAAIAFYEKAGFQYEGTHREFLRRDGRWHDMLLYGLLSHEWEARQGK
jgi:RimJ/RimL family protein N-acetyltransferase